MNVIDEAVAFARAMANDDTHGYDQGSRWGPDYDCSSLVISAFKKAGVTLFCTYTGNMRQDMLAHGFKDVTGSITLKTGKGLKKGDVLLHEAKHTALYIGDGKIVNAGGNEYGGATGGRTGDQTGRELAICNYYNFPWEFVLRYEGKDTSPAAQDDSGEYSLYTVKHGDSFWGIAERELGNGLLYDELRKFNGCADYFLYPGQVLKLPKKEAEDPGEPSPAPQDDSESITVKMKKTVVEKMRKAAEEKGITLAELIEEAFK